MRKCDKNIIKVLDLAKELTILADEGEQQAKDESCIVLYGIVRDVAYKIKSRAEEERGSHVDKGEWSGDQS
ncbi:MAG: hypothetical protein HQL32_09750 [Planctomycetes bacterium]|nr:hypothetical protein [Planctomycetota bacterium]